MHPGFLASKAFTLAEVLITLGIIGVVAALTLPTLIANGRKSETIARLKKFDSVMQQAILMATNDHGEPSAWEKSYDITLKDDEGNEILDDKGEVQYDSIKGSKDTYDFLAKYILPYIKYSKIEPYNEEAKRVVLYFDDGSIAYIKNGACIDFVFDVNGNRKPNKSGVDKYVFSLCTKHAKLYFGNPKVYWGASYITAPDRNKRERVKQECITSPVQCGRLIQLDGWEFADDYPIKI